MIKLLLWSVVLYFLFRWVGSKLSLPDGGNPGRPIDPPRRKTTQPGDDEEYIDYEELK